MGLALPVEVCKGVVVTLGHSLGAMAEEDSIHVGSYSFFDRIADAADEPRLQTTEQYQRHHQNEYRALNLAIDFGLQDAYRERLG